MQAPTPPLTPDVPEDEDEEPWGPPEALSFFADDKDPEVAHAIYRLYLRDSVERGFCSVEEQHRESVASAQRAHFDRLVLERARAPVPPRASAPPPDPVVRASPAPVEVRVMAASPTGRALTPRQAALVAAHKRLAATLGRSPSAQELFEEGGKTLGNNDNAVGMAARRIGLELTDGRKLLAARLASPRAVEPAPKKSAAPRDQKAPPTRPAPRSRSSSGKDDALAVVRSEAIALTGAGARAPREVLLAALEDERARIAAELAAFDLVLERLARVEHRQS